MKHINDAALGKLVATVLALVVATVATPTSLTGQEPSEESIAARIELGRKLFEQQAFTNGAVDYAASCSGCHSNQSGLQDRETRRFADYTAQSMMATKKLTARNTPTLLDVGKMARLGWTGEYDSLEGMIEDKLTGEPMAAECGRSHASERPRCARHSRYRRRQATRPQDAESPT